MIASTQSCAVSFFDQLLLPLQGVVNFFSPPVPAMSSFSGSAIGSQPRLAKAPTLPRNARATAAQILRSRRAQDGRIVISGRMRDVCAELDRLCDEPA